MTPEELWGSIPVTEARAGTLADIMIEAAIGQVRPVRHVHPAKA